MYTENNIAVACTQNAYGLKYHGQEALKDYSSVNIDEDSMN